MKFFSFKNVVEDKKVENFCVQNKIKLREIYFGELKLFRFE